LRAAVCNRSIRSRCRCRAGLPGLHGSEPSCVACPLPPGLRAPPLHRLATRHARRPTRVHRTSQILWSTWIAAT